MLSVKPVTQCNSARASCANRVNGGGLFASAPSARGSALGRRCWAALRPAGARGREDGVGRTSASWAEG